MPLLQAETDRDLVRRLAATREREAAIMEGAPAVTSTASSSSSSGEESSSWSALDLKAKTPGVGKGGLFDPHQAEPVYHTDRYVAPTFVIV